MAELVKKLIRIKTYTHAVRSFS